MKSQALSQKSKSDVSEDAELCTECSGRIISDTSGERVCEDCGLVVDDTVIDHGADWRSFDDDLKRSDPKRVGSPMTRLRHDKGLSTQMGNPHVDGHGNSIDSSRSTQLRRLQKWNKRYKVDSHERGVRFALAEIKRMGSALGVSRDVRETAAVLYRRCFEEDMIVGYSIEGIAAACLYIATRQSGTPQTLKDIFVVSRLSAGDDDKTKHITSIGRIQRKIVSELSITLEPADPEKYLDRYMSELGVSSNQMKIRRDAEQFIQAVKLDNAHSGVSPATIAATAVYCAAGINDQYCTQRDVCSVADVAVETIRSQYKVFCDVVGIDRSALKYSGEVEVEVFE